MKAFAIDDLIINEEGAGGDNLSALQQVTGLAGSQAQMARRHGARPVVAGLEQMDRRFFLETWLHGDNQAENRRLLFQYLNTDQNVIRRLTAVDAAPPVNFGQDVLLAMGPWDVYCTDDGAWKIRDCLQPDSIEAAISGAVHFTSGERSSATVRAAETVNYVKNPVAGGSWLYANYNGGVLDRSTTRYLFDSCAESSFVLTASATNEGGMWSLESIAAGLGYVSFWMYSEDVTSEGLQISLNGSDWYDVTVLETSGEWTRCGAVVTLASSATILYVRVSASISTSAFGSEWTTTPGAEWTTTPGAEWMCFIAQAVVYLDGLQVEVGLTATSFRWGGMEGYGWSGTAHASATELPEAILAGAIYGERTRAILNERATTNQVKNPVAGALGNFANLGGIGTVERSQDVYLFDQRAYSFKLYVGGPGNGGEWTLAALLNDDHSVSFWQYAQSPSYVNDLQISLDNSNWHDVDVIAADGNWTRYGALVPAAQANGSTMLYIKQAGIGWGTFYVDGIQVEAQDSPTTVAWGDAGPGYSWSGTEHASSTSRAETEIDVTGVISDLADYSQLSIEMTFQFPYDYDSDWPDTQVRILEFIDQIIYLDKSSETLNVTEPGGLVSRISVDIADLAWMAGDWIHLALSMDGDGEARLYWNGSQVGCTSAIGWLPTVDVDSYIGVKSAQANLAIAHLRVYGWAMTSGEAVRAYLNSVWRARWVDVQVEQVQPRVEGGRPLPGAYVSTVVIDGDTRWRSRDGDYAPWRIHTETGDLRVVVDSDDEVYPEFRFTPVEAKSNGFLYKRWCPVIWQSDYAGVNWAISIEPPNLGGYVQTSGNDLRVYDGGQEIDRWLLGTIPSAMQVWVNLDFAPRAVMTLGTAITETESVEQITVVGDIANMPQTGVVLIGTEAFTYAAKSTEDGAFTGVVRGARGTTEAEHAAGAMVYWIQHDLMLYYGDDALGAPDVDNDHAPTFVYQPRETGDDKDLLGGWDGVTGIAAANTDGGVLYVVVVYDGSSTFHVELYMDAGCAPADLVGHTAGYTSTGAQAVVADNASGLGGTILIESVDGPAILETGDDKGRLSDWDNITGVTPYNTDAGGLYVSIIYDGAGYSHVDLYKDPAKVGGDLVGHTATYNSTGAKAVVADNASGLGGTITVDSMGSFVESGDSKGYLSGWDSITGITSSNTDDYVLYASVARDGGGFFHVDLYKDVARGAGDLVGHTATYNSTGAKAIVADNGSGLGGTITVDAVGSTTESGDTNSQLSGWDNITGLDEDNTDNGTLYVAIIREGGGNYRLGFFSDEWHNNLVGHTATYNSTGAKAIVADNSSGLAGTITVDSLTMPTPWDSGDGSNVLSGWENVTGITYAVCGRGPYGGNIIARSLGYEGSRYVELENGSTLSLIAHTATYSTAGAKTLIEDNGSGIGGTVTVNRQLQVGCTVWMDFAIETIYGLAGGIQVQFEYETGIQAAFYFGITVEWSLVSGDSSNTEWTFLRFGENDGLRSAAWQCSIGVQDGDNIGRYTGDYDDGEQYADPWEEIGLDLAPSWKQFWSFYSPCEIVNANFEDGEYNTTEANRQARVDSSKNGVLWQEEYDVAPAGAGTWTAWSQDVALKVGSRYVRMYGQAIKLECDKVTLTFNPARVPIVSVYAQQDNYALACTLTNETTGEAIEVAANIEVNTLLIVDTNARMVRLADGTRMQYALEKDSVRPAQLRLLPGVNDLAFAETGASNLEIDVLWQRRDFE